MRLWGRNVQLCAVRRGHLYLKVPGVIWNPTLCGWPVCSVRGWTTRAGTPRGEPHLPAPLSHGLPAAFAHASSVNLASSRHEEAQLRCVRRDPGKRVHRKGSPRVRARRLRDAALSLRSVSRFSSRRSSRVLGPPCHTILHSASRRCERGLLTPPLRTRKRGVSCHAACPLR